MHGVRIETAAVHCDIVHAPLDRVVAGVRVREGRRPCDLCARLNTLVAGRANGLRQPRVAPLGLLLKGHRLVACPVGERRTVNVQIAVDELSDEAEPHAGGRAGEDPIRLMPYRKRGALQVGQQYLLHNRHITREHLPVRVVHTRSRVQAVALAVHQNLRRIGRLVQEPVRRALQIELGVVLPERPFKECHTGFQRERHVLGDQRARGVVGRRDVGDREVEVFQHLVHHHRTRVAAAIERGVGDGERLVDPGHIAVALHLLEVEPRAEETRHAGVVVPGPLGERRVGVVLQKVVDAPQGGPLPVDVATKRDDFVLSCAREIRNARVINARSNKLWHVASRRVVGHRFGARNVVRVGHPVVERVRVQRQTVLGSEHGLLARRRDRRLLQRVAPDQQCAREQE